MPDFALTLRKEAVATELAMKAAANCTLKVPQRRQANLKPRVNFLLIMKNEEMKT